MDYRFEEMVKESIQSSLTMRHNLHDHPGANYGLTTELFWRGGLLTSSYTEIPKDPGLKLAEKL